MFEGELCAAESLMWIEHIYLLDLADGYIQTIAISTPWWLSHLPQRAGVSHDIHTGKSTKA